MLTSAKHLYGSSDNLKPQLAYFNFSSLKMRALRYSI
jgi:hypothetical protein